MGKKIRNDKRKWKTLARKINEIPSIFDFVKEPLKAGLWCLYIAENKFGIDYLNAKEIESILQDYLGIPIKAIQIIGAFTGAKGKTIFKKEDKVYKISWEGKEYLKSLKIKKPLNVIYLAQDKPVTAESSLDDLIKSIKTGHLLITDPYYGLKTLRTLCEFAEYHKSVKFLTTQLGRGERPTVVDNFLQDVKREYRNKIKIKIYPNRYELHDRYILAKDIFFIVGHGIKDLGNKESLIVAIEDRYGKDIRKVLEKKFNERWDNSQVL